MKIQGCSARTMYERAYLRPGDTTAADLNNMLRPYVISGGIQP